MLLVSAPVGLKTVDLLGLRVADLTPELAAVYALGVPDGVMILDPGQDPERLDIGVLAEGHCFNRVGHERIHNTRELVARILADAHAPWGDSGATNPVRLTFMESRWEQGGGQVTFTEADLASLKALSQEFDGAEK